MQLQIEHVLHRDVVVVERCVGVGTHAVKDWRVAVMHRARLLHAQLMLSLHRTCYIT